MSSISLGKKLSDGTGGEGSVYNVEGRPDIVYKQYKPYKVTPEVQGKLNYMKSLNFNTNMNANFSWPIEVVGNSAGKLDGFTMNRLKFDIKLNSVYSDKGKIYPYEFSVVVGINLCAMVNQIHQQKFEIVIGDFNHDNVGVEIAKSFVSMMDIDSFHLGMQYPCVVCMQGYVAPELLKLMEEVNVSRFDDPLLVKTFTKETDLFSLAVHLFRLLMNGVSPYNGIDTKTHKSSDVVEAGNNPVKEGNYVFRPGLSPAHPACPPKYILTDRLITLFDRAFVDVKDSQHQPVRPTALEWIGALEEYRSTLIRCSKDKTHQYYNRLTGCPWCEAEQRESSFLSKVSTKLTKQFTIQRL